MAVREVGRAMEIEGVIKSCEKFGMKRNRLGKKSEGREVIWVLFSCLY